MVNRLLMSAGAALTVSSARYAKNAAGVKRVPQRDFGIPRFTYDGDTSTLHGESLLAHRLAASGEIRLALRYRSNDSLLRHFKDTSTLYLELWTIRR